MTNAGTAVSVLELFKTGWYFVGDSASSGIATNRNGYGYFWFSMATVDAEARRMYYGDGSLQIGVRYKRGSGYSVRCETLSLIFSPEAMGWPWEIRRTGTRRC